MTRTRIFFLALAGAVAVYAATTAVQTLTVTTIAGQPIGRSTPRFSGSSLAAAGTATGLVRFDADAGPSLYVKIGDPARLFGSARNGFPPYAASWTLDGSTAAFSNQLQATLDTTSLSEGTHTAVLDVIDDRGIELKRSTKIVAFRESAQTLADQKGSIGPSVRGQVPAQASVSFSVAPGTRSIVATLTYDNTAFLNGGQGDLTVNGPGGVSRTSRGNGINPVPVQIDSPAPGEWTAVFTLDATIPAPVNYEIQVNATQASVPDPRPRVATTGPYAFVPGQTQQLHATVSGGTPPYQTGWDLTQTGDFSVSGTDPVTSFDLGKYLVTFRAVDASGFDSRVTTAVRVAQDGAKAFGPYVVIALSDTGINPYHDDFGAAKFPDAQVLAQTANFTAHPSTYIPGYPASTGAIPITLGQGYVPPADEHLWDVGGVLQTNKLYWIPGTKIIGALDAGLGDGVTGVLDTLKVILDTNGHGTASASVAVGNIDGTCPTCLVVVIKGLGGETWAYDQPWIDIVTNSYGALLNAGTPIANPPIFPRSAAERGQIALYAGGNGNEDAFVTPEQTYTSETLGPDWVIRIGAVDRSTRQPFLGTGKPVNASSFGLGNIPAADYQSTGGQVQHNGTSAATPQSAGVMATALAAVRLALGDTGAGQRAGVSQGVIAFGRPMASSPYLADGALTRSELIEAVLKTAQHGDSPPTVAFPEEIPPNKFQYAVEGYGILETASGIRAQQVLFGQAPLPARDAEDAFFARDSALRVQLWGPWAGGGSNSAHASAAPLPSGTFAGVTSSQVSTFWTAMTVLGVANPAGTTPPPVVANSSAGSATQPGVLITDPADGTFYDPGTASTTADGTVTFPPSAFPAQANRFFLRRDGCGSSNDNPHLSRQQATSTSGDQMDGCSLVFQFISAAGLVDFATNYPLTPADLPVVLGSGQPASGILYEEAPTPTQLSLTIELVTGAVSLGSQTVTALVTTGPTPFPFSFAIPDEFVGTSLDQLALVVHITNSQSESATDSVAAASYVDLPLAASTVPAGAAVQVSVDDAAFASPIAAALAPDLTWSATVALTGLALDPAHHTLYARALLNGSAGPAASALFRIGSPPPSPGRVQLQLAPFRAQPSPAWTNAADLVGDGTYGSWSAAVDASSLANGRYWLYSRILRFDGTTLTDAPIVVRKQ
ncbi:MAG: S8/S53 family peptidase [Myxococcales bacterium]